MPLPYTFLSGTVARSAEVNANFEFLEALIGSNSTPDRVNPLGEWVFGPRSNTLFTGRADTGSSVLNRFFQIGWNADFNLVSGSQYRFDRFTDGEPATAIRIGQDGFSVRSTAKTTGDLNSQMVEAFRVGPDDNGGSIYIRADYHMRHTRAPRGASVYRLTYTPIINPPAVIENQTFGRGARVYQVSNFRIPIEAVAVSFNVLIQAGSGQDVHLRIMPEGQQRSARSGMQITAQAGRLGSGWGIVPLGDGAYAGKFVVDASATVYRADIYITGFWM